MQLTILVYVSLTSQMQEGEAETVASRLAEILSVNAPRSTEYVPPSLDLTGHWQVQVEFYICAQ